MKVYKTKDGAIIEKEGQFYKRQFSDWDNFINRENLHYLLLQEVDGLTPINNPNISENSITPIGGQEIWASGVTYKRSREARMEESKNRAAEVFIIRFMMLKGRSCFSSRPLVELRVIRVLYG